MRDFGFHPEAEAELLAAAEYYENLEPGLGSAFATEIETALNNILNFPAAWPVVDSGIRRCQTVKFPFGLLYDIVQDQIVILAVMHLSRSPDYWKIRRD